MSFRLKTIIGIALIELILVLLLLVSGMRWMKSSNETQLLSFAQMTISLFTHSIKRAVISSDLAELDNAVSELLVNKRIVYARIKNDRAILAQGGDLKFLQRPFHADQNLSAINDSVYDVQGKIQVAGEHFATIDVGISTEEYDNVLTEAEQFAPVIALAGLLLSAFFSFILGSYLTRQLEKLKMAAQHIAEGSFGEHIEPDSNDELGKTILTFNQMSQQLSTSYGKIKSSEQLLRSMFNSSSDAMLILRDGKIVKSNSAGEKMLGLDLQSDRFRDLSFLDFSEAMQDGVPAKEAWEEKLAQLKHSVCLLFEWNVKDLKNEKIMGELLLSKIEYESRPALQLTIRDISQRKKMENTLIAEKNAAELSSRSKSQYLSNMGDEFQTSINSVAGMLNMLKATHLDRHQQEYLEAAGKAVATLQHAIHDILDVSKVDSGSLEPTPVEYDLRATIGACVRELARRAFTKKMDFSCYISPEVPLLVKGDSRRFTQIINNLVGDVVGLTDEGSIDLQFTMLDGTPGAREEILRISILNRKISQDLITDTSRHHDLKNGSDMNKPGNTGLGLSISRQYIELMGGHLGIEVDETNGNKLNIEIPCQRVSSHYTDRENLDISILVVEINKNIQRCITQGLSPLGVDVVFVDNVEMALRALNDAKISSRDIPVLLLDARIAIKEESRLWEYLRGDLHFEDVKVILLSNMTRDETSSFEGRYYHILSKPIDTLELQQCIRKTCDKVNVSAHKPIVKAGLLKERGEEVFSNLSGRVLLVDDNDINRMVIRENLSATKLKIDEAADGIIAVEAFLENDYQLVFMDCQMPNMDGYAATMELRRIEKEKLRAVCPIIAFTALDNEDDKRRCIDAGMNGCLVKPVDKMELLRTVKQYLLDGKNASSSELTNKTPNIDGDLIDMKRFHVLYSVLGDSIRDIRNQFVENASSLIRRLESAAKKGEPDQMKSVLHSLNECCGNLALKGLVNKCSEIDRSMFNDGHDSLLTKLDEIKVMTELSIAQLDEKIAMLAGNNSNVDDQKIA